MSLRDSVKSGMPGLAARIRRMGRFRFLLKARQVRLEGARFRDDPVNVARFVLFDPETHSYSYELRNREELVDFCASLLGIERSVAAAYVEEALTDPELTTELTRRVRWRIDYKREMPLGNRLLWYVVARAAQPRLVVETGIFDGLGSLMLLRALERNADDGVDGRLVSIDLEPESGWIVPDRLRARWEPVFGDIFTDLEPALRGREVDMLIHDSVHEEDFQRFEFGLALENAGDPLYLVDCSGEMLPVLRELSDERGGRRDYFLERPARHFYKPPGTTVAIVERAA